MMKRLVHLLMEMPAFGTESERSVRNRRILSSAVLPPENTPIVRINRKSSSSEEEILGYWFLLQSICSCTYSLMARQFFLIKVMQTTHPLSNAGICSIGSHTYMRGIVTVYLSTQSEICIEFKTSILNYPFKYPASCADKMHCNDRRSFIGH